MNRTKIVRHLLLGCITLFLLILAWGALSGALRQIPRASTVGQHAETLIQLGCGVLSIVMVFTCFWWRQWARRVQTAWAISLVAAAGLSSLVWGPPMPLVTLAFVTAATLLALGTVWTLRRLARGNIDLGEQPEQPSEGT